MIGERISQSIYVKSGHKIVDRVVKGLVMRKIKYGYAYCPCRLVMRYRKDKDHMSMCLSC